MEASQDDQEAFEVQDPQELVSVKRRRTFNTSLITGDQFRDALDKDLITKVDKVQRWLTKFKTLAQNANEYALLLYFMYFLIMLKFLSKPRFIPFW